MATRRRSSETDEQRRTRLERWTQAVVTREILLGRVVETVRQQAGNEWVRRVAIPVIERAAARLSTFEPRGQDVTPSRYPQIASIQAGIAAEIDQGAARLRVSLRDQLLRVADNENEWVRRTGAEALGLPAPPPRVSVPAPVNLEQHPFLGKGFDRWFGDMVQGPARDRVGAFLQQGLQRGLTTDEIVRGLRGTRANGYADGILTGKSRHEVRALARTAGTAWSSRRREEALRGIGVEQVVWVSVLDARTSKQCLLLDGTVFEVDDGPRPPIHPNCRSNVAPWAGEMFGTRASEDGPVPANLDGRAWLRRASAERQDLLLGKRLGRAFRKGEVDLDDIVGDDLEPLTIEEIIAKGLKVAQIP